jgi:hypothetical protein
VNRWKERFDRLIRQICKWLDDFFPGDHGLAVLSDNIAGVRGWVLLPVDRRTPDHVFLDHSNGGENQFVSKAKGSSSTKAGDCNFWAYCYLKGQPCIWCGGNNSVDKPQPIETTPTSWITRVLCPKGKNALNAWYGCCTDPAGTLHLIAFVDCCGTGECSANPFNVCKNWPQAKNWCTVGPDQQTFRTGPNSYYCTVAVNAGDCAGDP